MFNSCLVHAGRHLAFTCLSVSLLVMQGVSGNAQNSQVFNNPTLLGMPLDRCLTWATNCDEPAAAVFCRYQGYSSVAFWRWEYASRTIVQGDGRICDRPNNGCGAFVQITCQ
jgi:hypothetical protein